MEVYGGAPCLLGLLLDVRPPRGGLCDEGLQSRGPPHLIYYQLSVQPQSL
eukprot:CAMPEP_0183447768 /NCGR_PEP_ID=MMETSP0370-20130417/103752_1 /TAXON_ID=268820 /ORGANISM="Peridinium aciculiferum, Strain PAER-2" /LENGTH=49 /DNA_ID= /DNA_START= /DNA_END= /DNA_ORIENTATION=